MIIQLILYQYNSKIIKQKIKLILSFGCTQDSTINAFYSFAWYIKLKLNSMVWVRERTIPTERPPHVSEVISNFLRIEGATLSAWRISTAVFSVFWTGADTFYQDAPQLYSRAWEGPVPDPLHFSASAGNRTHIFTCCYLLLFDRIANAVLPGGSGSTVRNNAQKYTSHTTWHIKLKQNTAH
jgi:hypothetical protein